MPCNLCKRWFVPGYLSKHDCEVTKTKKTEKPCLSASKRFLEASLTPVTPNLALLFSELKSDPIGVFIKDDPTLRMYLNYRVRMYSVAQFILLILVWGFTRATYFTRRKVFPNLFLKVNLYRYWQDCFRCGSGSGTVGYIFRWWILICI